MWKSVIQVFKFQVLSSKGWKRGLQVFEVFNVEVWQSVWKTVPWVVESFNTEVWGVREVIQVSCKGFRKTCF